MSPNHQAKASGASHLYNSLIPPFLTTTVPIEQLNKDGSQTLTLLN